MFKRSENPRLFDSALIEYMKKYHSDCAGIIKSKKTAFFTDEQLSKIKRITITANDEYSYDSCLK